MPEKDFDLAGRLLNRERFDTEFRIVPKADWQGTLDFQNPNAEGLAFRMNAYLNLIEGKFSPTSEYDDENPEPRDYISADTSRFCIASGQRALEYSLKYALEHGMNIPTDILSKAKSAVEKHKAFADEFYGKTS